MNAEISPRQQVGSASDAHSTGKSFVLGRSLLDDPLPSISILNRYQGAWIVTLEGSNKPLHEGLTAQCHGYSPAGDVVNMRDGRGLPDCSHLFVM